MLALTAVLLITPGLALSILCAVGWKRKSDEAIKSANYNASLWAESELKNAELRLENASLAVRAEIYERHYYEARDIAIKTIRIRAEQVGLDPDEVLPDDSILSADHLE